MTVIIATDPIYAIDMAKRVRNLLECELKDTIVELDEVSTILAS